MLQDMDVREVKAQAVQTQRELRYLSFASVEYGGQVYMTPQDFLESLMEDAPRRKYFTQVANQSSTWFEPFLKDKIRPSTNISAHISMKGWTV